MNEEEAVKELEELVRTAYNHEAENHIRADDILLEFCPSRVREVYEKLMKWYE